jgi:transposase-like protein
MPAGRRSGRQKGGEPRAHVHRLPARDLPADLVQQLQDLLNKELRRRIDAVGIFAGHDAVVRLVGAMLMAKR